MLCDSSAMANKFSKTSSVVGEGGSFWMERIQLLERSRNWNENLPPFKGCQNPSVLSQMKLSMRTRVFSGVCWNCNLWWCILLSHTVSNDFMAANYKRNQANNNNLIEVSCFPMLILEKLFLKTVSLSLFIFGDKGFFVLKPTLLLKESWQ